MAELLSRADWRGGMGFDIHAGDHTFIIDAPTASGGKNEGPKPTYMLVAGLMSCTGMDVASILEKMRVPLRKFHLETSTDVADEDPHVFRKIDLVYHFEGDKDLKDYGTQIKKAIQLSKETYCCVSIMFKRFCPINLRAFVNGVELAL
ncbi:MAG: OsmC family protein [Desulfobacteraceae bacterium]|nr:OsmC family protein [Desulfobacteraceae bacterium]